LASCSDTLGVLRLSLVIGSLACAGLAGEADAKVFHSRKDAIALAFPTADRIEKETHILSAAQTEAVERLARARVDKKLVTIFTAWDGEEIQGYAHVDVHTVRTHPAALLVVLTPAGGVRSVRILAFHEPLDYLPSEKWYQNFVGSDSSDALRVGRDVHGVVNATLSAHAAADSVRRALAYHAVLIAKEPVRSPNDSESQDPNQQLTEQPNQKLNQKREEP
jgi:hypothetical protein